jgi:hypothetical protein
LDSGDKETETTGDGGDNGGEGAGGDNGVDDDDSSSSRMSEMTVTFEWPTRFLSARDGNEHAKGMWTSLLQHIAERQKEIHRADVPAHARTGEATGVGVRTAVFNLNMPPLDHKEDGSAATLPSATSTSVATTAYHRLERAVMLAVGRYGARF